MVLGRADDDEALIQRIASGDRSALGGLYDRYASLLLAVARRILGDRIEAEDLLHDLFLELWRRAGDFEGARGSARTWILLRLRSRALDRRRTPRSGRTVTLGERAAETLAAPEDPHLVPDRARVRRALAELPREQRAVLELGYFEGLSSSEIAARIAAPIGTVKSRVAAGLAKLRGDLLGLE